MVDNLFLFIKFKFIKFSVRQNFSSSARCNTQFGLKMIPV
jgi:hypothetical protein